jgi:FkbM family methyltransferase
LLAAASAGARRDLRDEIAGRALLAALLGRDSTFVDVGANTGQWLEAAVRCAPDGRHVAFEPVPTVAAKARARFSQVDVRAVALSDHAGEETFSSFPEMSGFSGLRRRTDVPFPTVEIKVRVARLDDEVDVPVCVLKIDVEGAELPVLRGSTRILTESRPVVIFEHQPEVAALYGAGSGDLWDLLLEHGYRIYDLQGGGPLEADAFAERAHNGIVNWLAQPA